MLVGSEVAPSAICWEPEARAVSPWLQPGVGERLLAGRGSGLVSLCTRAEIAARSLGAQLFCSKRNRAEGTLTGPERPRWALAPVLGEKRGLPHVSCVSHPLPLSCPLKAGHSFTQSHLAPNQHQGMIGGPGPLSTQGGRGGGILVQESSEIAGILVVSGQQLLTLPATGLAASPRMKETPQMEEDLAVILVTDNPPPDHRLT